MQGTRPIERIPCIHATVAVYYLAQLWQGVSK